MREYVIGAGVDAFIVVALHYSLLRVKVSMKPDLLLLRFVRLGIRPVYDNYFWHSSAGKEPRYSFAIPDFVCLFQSMRDGVICKIKNNTETTSIII